MTGTGHPLPASDEARHDQIPERLEREKGQGDDAKAATRESNSAVNPDGEPYDAGDLGGASLADEFAADQAAHQDRGQSVAEEESDR